MQHLTSGTTGRTYRLARPLPHFGEGFYQAFADTAEVTVRVAEAGTPAATALREEAWLLERIHSPRVAGLHDRGRSPTHVFLVLDGPAGQPLADLLGERDLTTTAALDLLLQALEALEALHAAGVAWGWLRPNAFWVDRAGKLKLVNLRGAGSGNPPGPRTLAEATYLAPECAPDAPPTLQADLYAWGALAFEVLAGRPPFNGSTVTELAIRHMSEPAPDLARIRADLPPDLCALVGRCLAKSPDARPPSAAEVRAALEPIARRLIDDELARSIACPRCQGRVPLQPRCPLCNAPLGVPAVPPARRRRIGPLLVIAASALVSLVLIGLLLGGGGPAEATDQPPATATAGTAAPAAAPAGTAAPAPTRLPTPLPTATAAPVPAGVLAAPAGDVADPNIDIIRAWASSDDAEVIVAIDVAGQIHTAANRATYQVYFDQDGDPASGDRTTPWPGLGADLTALYRSGDAAAQVLRWQGDTWHGVGAAATEVRGGQLRLHIPRAWFGGAPPRRYAVLAANTEANLADVAPARDHPPVAVGGPAPAS